MGMAISVDILVGPIVGGLGTVFGPLVGFLITIPLDHLASAFGDRIGIPGLNNVAYGLILIVTVWFMPDGIWPALSSVVKSFNRFPRFRSLQVERAGK